MQDPPPSSVGARIASATSLWQLGASNLAEIELRNVRAIAPACEDAAMLLVEVLRAEGRFSAAVQVLLELCSANAFEVGLCARAARLARQCDRHSVAAQICSAAFDRGVVSAELLVIAGHVARELGDFETARKHYLAALENGVDLTREHMFAALASTKQYADAADLEVSQFHDAFHNLALGTRARASAGFALAKAMDDANEIESAAVILREANALVRAVQPWSAATWHSFVEARSGEHVAKPVTHGSSAFIPVFIVGTPRSGTTLTARLLAGSGPVKDRGEQRALPFIATRLVKDGYLSDSSAILEGATLYRNLAVQDDAPAIWYLDQDPMNFRWLHVVAAMFPQAKVIHLRRNRRATALSLWSQDFAHPNLGFSYSFEEMHAFMVGHDALMRHWHAVLSIPIFELDYATLVSAPERTLATLRDFIGAPGRAAGTTSADAAPVQSASVWQARQPVYTTSVGRWRKYLPYVPELERFA